MFDLTTPGVRLFGASATPAVAVPADARPGPGRAVA